MSENGTGNQVDVAVLGAGIVGISAGIAARQRGLSVVVIDRREPGSETSYGNAGILSSGSILPLNKPSLWRALPSYLGNTSAALRWDPVWAMRNLDWVARFLGNAVSSRTRPRAIALHGLIGASLKLHRDWIVKAGAGNRIRETGWLKAWRSEATEAARQEQAFLAEFGIKSELLDRQAISALEPNILPVYTTGLLHSQTASVDSPGNVVKAYARMLSKASAARSASPTSGQSNPRTAAGASCSATAPLLRAMSWWRSARGRPICCGRSAIACRSRPSAAIIRSSRPIRHAPCSVRSMMPKAVS
jgi:D-amino-acid dehydrogenase